MKNEASAPIILYLLLELKLIRDCKLNFEGRDYQNFKGRRRRRRRQCLFKRGRKEKLSLFRINKPGTVRFEYVTEID